MLEILRNSLINTFSGFLRILRFPSAADFRCLETRALISEFLNSLKILYNQSKKIWSVLNVYLKYRHTLFVELVDIMTGIFVAVYINSIQKLICEHPEI